jgi:hypothetical protein
MARPGLAGYIKGSNVSNDKQDILHPQAIDVGLSPDFDGSVVSIFTTATKTTVIPLPPEAALAYGEKLIAYAKRLVAGEVGKSFATPDSQSIEMTRIRPERLDS